MPWIRFDCSTLDDDFVIDLPGEEFKAWALFLLRVKAMGARGSVKVASLSSLARNWRVPETAIASMLAQAAQVNARGVPKIYEKGGRWYVSNWKRYQEDYREKDEPLVSSTENPRDATNGTTPHYTTPQDTTPQKELVVDALKRDHAKNLRELKNMDFVLRLHDDEFVGWMASIQRLIVAENQGRSRNPFSWRPTTGSFESDMKKLIYQLSDEKKKDILTAAYNILGEKTNWPNYIELAIRYTIRVSERTRIAMPFQFTVSILQRPNEVVSAKSDGMLSGSAHKISVGAKL